MALMACGGTEPTGQATLRLSESSARPAPGAVLTAELTNVGEQTLYLDACGRTPSLDVDQRIGFEWQRISSSICPANLLTSRVALGTGETRILSRQLSNSMGAGRFRLRVSYGDVSEGESVTVATAEFEIAN